MLLPEEEEARPLWQTLVYFISMLGILVFANWGQAEQTTGLWALIYSNKWLITSCFSAALAVTLMLWFSLPKWQILLAALPPVILSLVFSAEKEVSHEKVSEASGGWFLQRSPLLKNRGQRLLPPVFFSGNACL